jgi:hypothetical protein
METQILAALLAARPVPSAAIHELPGRHPSGKYPRYRASPYGWNVEPLL